MAWKVVKSDALSAAQNMSLDHERLLSLSSSSEPLLHFYNWKKPSLTYGYFIAPEKVSLS